MGLLIASVQAATSINEMTLVLCKMVVVILTFGLLASFAVGAVVGLLQFIFDQIVQIG